MGLVESPQIRTLENHRCRNIANEKSDGSYCSTLEENAEVFHQHFQNFTTDPQIST